MGEKNSAGFVLICLGRRMKTVAPPGLETDVGDGPLSHAYPEGLGQQDYPVSPACHLAISGDGT